MYIVVDQRIFAKAFIQRHVCPQGTTIVAACASWVMPVHSPRKCLFKVLLCAYGSQWLLLTPWTVAALMIAEGMHQHFYARKHVCMLLLLLKVFGRRSLQVHAKTYIELC